MNSALQRYLEAASGLTTLTSAKAERVVKGLVRSGEAASDQVSDLVEDLLDRQRRNREAMVALVKSETTRAVRAMGLATGKEIERLQQQVADLQRELDRLEQEEAVTSAPVATAAAEEARTGTTSRKTSAKKTSGKKTSAKSTSRTTSGKRAAGKKAATKKASAKRSSAKKTAAKKSSAKKAVGAPLPTSSEVLAERIDESTGEA